MASLTLKIQFTVLNRDTSPQSLCFQNRKKLNTPLIFIFPDDNLNIYQKFSSDVKCVRVLTKPFQEKK